MFIPSCCLFLPSAAGRYLVGVVVAAAVVFEILGTGSPELSNDRCGLDNGKVRWRDSRGAVADEFDLGMARFLEFDLGSSIVVGPAALVLD